MSKVNVIGQVSLLTVVIILTATAVPVSGGVPLDPDGDVYTFIGKTKAKVSGEGSSKGTSFGAIAFVAGEWAAVEEDDDHNEYEYSGTYTRRSKKKFYLYFDGESRDELEGAYEDWASSEFGTSVTVTITSITAKMKLKKAGLRGKVTVKVKGTASGPFGTKKLTVKSKMWMDLYIP